PVIIRGDTHLGKSRSQIRRAARSILMPLFYNAVDFVFATGTRNDEYYKAMGVDEWKIIFLPFSIDNERFSKQSRLTAAESASERRKFEIPTDRPAILFAAKLVAQKRPFDLLSAVQRVMEQTASPFQV